MTAYLDYAATAPMRPAASAAWQESVGPALNPASLHRSGRQASMVLEDSREQMASLLGVTPSEVVFTSGGTEANIIGMTGLYRRSCRSRILVGATEHKVVLDTAAALSADVVLIPVDSAGRVDPAVLADMLSDEVALVAVMAANNEVGTVNDLSGIAKVCTEAGVAWHCDAVQWPATRRLPPIPFDTLALSAHKIGGPVGVGALIVRRGLDLPVYSAGGVQEGGIRSGTVDTAGVAAFAAALAAVDLESEVARIESLRDDLQRRIVAAIPDVIVNGADADRLVSHLHLTFPGCEGDALLMLLDAAGVEVSTGSACTVGIPQPSHVLLAMGADPVAARGSLRFSLGWGSTVADVEAAAAAITSAVERARLAGSVRIASR